MATKKEKRAAALAKREAFMAAVKADGLAALKADQDRQAKKDASLKEQAAKINLRHRNILAQHGIALQKNHPEVTVGEFLEAADRLLPIFSG